MRTLLLLIIFISISFYSCGLNTTKEYTKTVSLVEISKIQKIYGIRVVKLELFNYMDLNDEGSGNTYKFYIANTDLIPKNFIGRQWKKAQGYNFGGPEVTISYKILRADSPLILTLTKFNINGE